MQFADDSMRGQKQSLHRMPSASSEATTSAQGEKGHDLSRQANLPGYLVPRILHSALRNQTGFHRFHTIGHRTAVRPGFRRQTIPHRIRCYRRRIAAPTAGLHRRRRTAGFRHRRRTAGFRHRRRTAVPTAVRTGCHCRRTAGSRRRRRIAVLTAGFRIRHRHLIRNLNWTGFRSLQIRCCRSSRTARLHPAQICCPPWVGAS